mgnify:CR=1 FL=1|jgi:Putative phage replication protein RstA
MAMLEELQKERTRLEEWLSLAEVNPGFAGKAQPGRWQKRLDAVNGDIASLEGAAACNEPAECSKCEGITLAINTQPAQKGVHLSDVVVLDWLELVFAPCEPEDLDDVLDVVRETFGPIDALEHGWRGYNHSGRIVHGTGYVAWSTNDARMGVYVTLSATALGELSRSVGDVMGLLTFLVDFGFRGRRVDLAMDDRTGLLDFGAMVRHLDAGNYTCRAKNSPEYTRSCGDERKRLLRFGSMRSDSHLVIYDKAAQLNVPGHWVRVELRQRRKRAGEVLRRIVAEGLAFVPGLVRAFLEFRQPTPDTNKSRWPVASWWARFLSFAKKTMLRLPKPERCLEKVKMWLEGCVAPSLALVMRSEGGAMGWLRDLLHDGDRRLKPRHLCLLEA